MANDTLDNLLALIQASTQQKPVETANVGGANLLVNRPQNALSFINSAATGYNAMNALNQKQQFYKEAAAIAQMQGTPEEKMNALGALALKHKGDYGLGLKDIFDQYASQNKAEQTNKALKDIYGIDESGNLVLKGQVPAKSQVLAKEKPLALSPTLEKVKQSRLENIINAFENAKPQSDMIANAEDSLKRIPQGRLGAIKIKYLMEADPNNPILTDWQNIKMVMTDAQLLNTAKTKGAISDKEMELFAKASANDDLLSIPRIIPVIAKLKRFLEAEKSRAVNAYRNIYKDEQSQSDLQQILDSYGYKGNSDTGNSDLDAVKKKYGLS